MPAGRGYVDGHFYAKSTDQFLESLLGTAALAAVAALTLTLAISQARWAATLRGTPRWVLVTPALLAGICTLAAALATTADFCDPDVCRTGTSMQMH